MKLLSHLQSTTPRWFAPAASLFALMCTFVSLPQNASAAELYWTGTGPNMKVITAANWSAPFSVSSAPGQTDSFLFNGSGTFSQKGEAETVEFKSLGATFGGGNSTNGVLSFTLASSQTTNVNFVSDETFNANYMRFGVVTVSGGTRALFALEAGSGSLTVDGNHSGTTPFRMTLNASSAASYREFRNDNPTNGSKLVLGQDVVMVRGGSSLAIHAIFSGAGDIDFYGRYCINLSSNIIKRGAGILTIGNDLKDNSDGFGLGVTVNQFDGSVILEQGQLNVNHSGALGDTAFRISGTSRVDNTSGTAIVLKYNPKIEIQNDFTFLGTNDLNLGTAQAYLTAPQRAITVAAGRLELGGNLNGSGVALIQGGAGTLVLGGDASGHTGVVAATNGAIMANGSILKSTGTAGSGATFGGSGTVGVVTIASGGTLQPGDLTLVKAGTFTGTIAGHSTLTIDRSLTTAQTLVQLNAGAVINFALGKGHTNTKVAVLNSSGAALKTVGFDNTVIKLTDLADGSAATGEYTLFTTDGAFDGIIDETFDGLTVDPATKMITAGLSVDMPAVYSQPNFGYRLFRADHGIVFKLYGAPTISGYDSSVEVVQGWGYTGAPLVFGGDVDTTDVTNLPPGLSYDPATFVISGTPTVGAGTYAAVISAVNPAATVTGTINFEVKDSVDKPEFTMDTIAIGSSTADFSYAITAVNLPQEYSIRSVTPLASWMDLVQDPITKVWHLTGTPDGPGIWEVTIRVANPSGFTDTTITVIIDGSTVAPVITSATSKAWVRGYPLSYQITADNGPGFFGVSGTLPAGLTLNALTGAIAGTPLASGTTTVTMHAINATGTGSSPLTFDIMDSMPQPVITSSTVAKGFLNESFSYTITATNFVTSTTVTSVLPSWLSYDGATATLSGTCTGDGATWALSGSTYPVVVEASNIVGTITGTVNVIIKQRYPIPVITNSGTNTCYAGRSYADQINVTSTVGIESYSGTGLPAGMHVDPATGAILGMPASAGDYTIILAATTSGGTGTGTVGLKVIPVPPGPFIDSPTTADGATGQPFSYQITAETPVTSYGAKRLPPGLSVDPATGVISGMPTAAGYYMVEISTTDAAGTFVQDVVLTLEPAGSTIVTYAGALQAPALVNATGTDARFNQPHTAAISLSGTIFVADFANNTIRAIATNGDVSSYITAGQPSAVATDSQGNIYIASQQAGAILKILPLDQTVWPVATGLSNPGGIAIDAQDNVYFTESGASANVIKKISAANGAVSILAGSSGAGAFANGTGTAARFNGPSGLAYDKASNTLYVADTLNSMIRGVNLATNAVTTVAGLSGATGFWDGGNGAARFDSPQGLSIDVAGFLYIADTGNNTIRVCDPKTGFVSTLMGVPQQAGAVDGNGSVALLDSPAGIVVDANGTGDIYVVDSGNSAIRSLLSPPCIVSPLVSATIKAGRPITLDGRAWGAPAPSYQWYKDGTAVSGSLGQVSTLLIDSAKAADAGTYRIVASSASGTVGSSMSLTVDTSSGAGSTVVIDGGGGGGGGAPSVWFVFGLAALALGRRIYNFTRANKR